MNINKTFGVLQTGCGPAQKRTSLRSDASFKPVEALIKTLCILHFTFLPVLKEEEQQLLLHTTASI